MDLDIDPAEQVQYQQQRFGLPTRQEDNSDASDLEEDFELEDIKYWEHQKVLSFVDEKLVVLAPAPEHMRRITPLQSIIFFNYHKS